MSLAIELVRSQDGGDRYRFDFTAQKYKRRRGPAAYQESHLPWSQRVLDALQGLSAGGRDPEAAQYLGDMLRDFLVPLGWDEDEREMERALRDGQEVHLTFRFAAAELYALPWELVTLRNSRRHLGAVAGVHLRYEAPRNDEPFAISPAPQAEGRLLLAWSGAGGAVPIAEHLAAIREACRRSSYPFDPREDVIGDVSFDGLRRALRETRRPVSALHILCHGGARRDVYGLSWSPATPGAEPDFIDAANLRELLAPHAGSLRLVVLCACTSGDAGPFGSHVGSVAQALHAIGIRAVIASRLPFSVEGSNLLAKTLYEHLLERHASLQQALLAAREELKSLIRTMDWATLQLYARQDEPLHQFPFVFRPYQGLLAFEPEHRAFFFGRAAQEQEWLERLREADRGARPRLQVLAGASGSGKSSLARAAIVPALAGAGWEVAIRRAADAALLQDLQRLQAERPRGSRLLLVDQFEELFTRPAEEREPIAQALWELSRADDLRTVVLLTLRLDALERCAELRLDGAGTRLSDVTLDARHLCFLRPLGADQYREAIVEPAGRAGLSFDSGLVEQMIGDAGQEPGSLPLMEYALDLLWERREGTTLTQAAYRALGGLTGALTRTMDQLHEKLSSAEQRQMRRLLVDLVDFRDDLALATRRRELVSRLRPVAQPARETFEVVVEKLVAQRLLVRSEDWIELAHEALIRRWDRLGQWLREDAERVRAIRTIRGWAQDWRAHRDERDGGAGYLPAGSRLAYLREIRAACPEVLEGDLETDFIQAAEAEDQRRTEGLVKSVQIAYQLLTEISGLTGTPGLDPQRRSLLEQVKQMVDLLIQSSESRSVAMLLRAAANNELGDIALELAEWNDAQKLYEESLRLSRDLHTQAPSESMGREFLAVSHDKLGMLAERRGDMDVALTHYQTALELTEQLAASQPEEIRYQVGLARALQRGHLAVAGKSTELVQGRLERALTLLQRLDEVPDAEMASCLQSLGDFEVLRGATDAAERYFCKGLVLMDSEAESAQERRQVAELYTRLGWLAFSRGDTTEARRRHLNALHLYEALERQEPRNFSFRRGRAVSLRSLGDVQCAEGEHEDARPSLLDARDLLEALLRRAPASADLRSHLDLTLGALKQLPEP